MQSKNIVLSTKKEKESYFSQNIPEALECSFSKSTSQREVTQKAVKSNFSRNEPGEILSSHCHPSLGN